MSDVNEANPNPDKKYAQISTETLEELLRYSVFSDETLNIDETREVLAELNSRNPRAPHRTPEDAWEIFNSEYSGNESSYSNCAYEENSQAEYRAIEGGHTPKFKTLRRAAVAAAVLVVVLVGGTITAYALGFDLWGTVAQWGRETFGFSLEEGAGDPYSEVTDEDIHITGIEQYDDLQTALLMHGITEQVAPTWIPDGFELDELKIEAATTSKLSFQAWYVNNEKLINVSVLVLYGEPNTAYEKDDGAVTVYEKNNIDHYIMTNNSRYLGVWMNNSLECSIAGDITKDDLIRMLDSIYER